MKNAITTIAILVAGVIQPIDVNKSGELLESADQSFVADTTVSIYIDHGYAMLFPKDQYSFYSEWRGGRYGVKTEVRNTAMAKEIVGLLDTGLQTHKEIDDEGVLAFKRQSRVVMVLTKDGRELSVYYFSKCSFLREGEHSINRAAADLVKWYGYVSDDFSACRK